MLKIQQHFRRKIYAKSIDIFFVAEFTEFIQMQAMLQGSLSSQHISTLMQQQQLLANAAAQQQVIFLLFIDCKII